MISHENLEKFLSLTPGWRVTLFATFLLLLAAAVYVLYAKGYRDGKAQFNSQIKQELDESVIRENGIRAEAERLAGINELLKAQALEAEAKIIAAENKRSKEAAENLQKIFDERKQKLAEIEAVNDPRQAVMELCEEAKKAGYEISKNFCLQAN